LIIVGIELHKLIKVYRVIHPADPEIKSAVKIKKSPSKWSWCLIKNRQLFRSPFQWGTFTTRI